MSYFSISVLFLDRFNFSVSTSSFIFLIGEAVNFIASVTGGLSFRSSLLLLQYFRQLMREKINRNIFKISYVLLKNETLPLAARST